MKYLKTYKLYESLKDIIQLDIKDILLDIEEDENIEVYIYNTKHQSPTTDGLRYQIRLMYGGSRKGWNDLSKGFQFNQVQDYLERLIEYLEPYESNRGKHNPQNKVSFQVNFFNSRLDTKLMSVEKFDLTYQGLLDALNRIGIDEPLRAIYIQIDIKEK